MCAADAPRPHGPPTRSYADDLASSLEASGHAHDGYARALESLRVDHPDRDMFVTLSRATAEPGRRKLVREQSPHRPPSERDAPVRGARAARYMACSRTRRTERHEPSPPTAP